MGSRGRDHSVRSVGLPRHLESESKTPSASEVRQPGGGRQGLGCSQRGEAWLEPGEGTPRFLGSGRVSSPPSLGRTMDTGLVQAGPSGPQAMLGIGPSGSRRAVAVAVAGGRQDTGVMGQDSGPSGHTGALGQEGRGRLGDAHFEADSGSV